MVTKNFNYKDYTSPQVTVIAVDSEQSVCTGSTFVGGEAGGSFIDPYELEEW